MIRPLRTLCIAAILATAGLTAGCKVIGVIAAKAPKPDIKAEYDLKGQSVGVMVWADRGVLIDWSMIQLDIAGGVQSRLLEAQKAEPKQFEGTTFPVLPASIIRWQRENPGHEAQPVAEIAPKLGVNRLIYIELSRFGTRAAQTIALYRGTATAKITVIAVDANGIGKIDYQSQDVQVVFPKTSTPEGSPRGTDQAMYVGTITALADEIAKKFVDHPEE
jgi:hypothetical protein